jgi:hypothetical protein
MQLKTIYTYTIDHDDRLISVSDGWNSFARNNGAEKNISQPHILNQKIWNFIADGETEYIYKELVSRVREFHVTANIKIRCDSSTERRYLDIEMSNVYDGFIQFDSRIEKVERRDRVLLLESDRPSSDEMLKVCSYCKKIDTGNETWEELEIAVNRLELFNCTPLPKITHGVCNECYTAFLAQLDALKKQAHAGHMIS